MGRFKKIITNTTIQSILFTLILTGIIISLWDIPVEKYIVEVDPFERKSSGEIYWFSGDFNSDGNSEIVRCYNSDMTGTFNIVHYDENGNITVNWHLNSSKWNYYLRPAVFDIDRDGYSELLFFTTRNDSIFFNAYSFKTFHLSIDHHFFNTFEKKRKNYAFQSEFSEFGDFNRDNNDELFFWFDAGFGLYPRGIFKMDFPSLKVTSSPTEHMHLHFSAFKDLNSDGIPEILTESGAPNNSFFSHKYTDSVSYITVLDYNLNFLFEPITAGAEYSAVKCIPARKNNSWFYALLRSRSNNQEPLKLLVIDKEGEILSERAWKNFGIHENRPTKIYSVNDVPWIVFDNAGRFELTKSLSKIPGQLKLSRNDFDNTFILADLNEDGYDGIISWNKKQQIRIYNKKENVYTDFKSPINIKTHLNVFPFLKNGEIVKYMFASRTGYFFVNYTRNKNYCLKYLLWFLVFILIGGTIRLLFYFQKRAIEKKWHLEKQLSELRFNAVKNQLNPHFLFNSLNSVACMINEGHKNEAYNFLTINSRMIQRVLDDSKNVKRTLKDEIQFTRDYLKIQEYRFDGRFYTEFKIHPEADLDFYVPKMCIHTYVENALKHGFRNTKKGGKLTVEISPLKKGVFIAISDNGIGRKEAAKYKDSTGHGLKTMEEFYTLFEKYHGYRIKKRIIDRIGQKDTATGTRVELKIEKSE
ncbi:MAG: histidine kinase [Tangfeifania sp.]